MQVEKIIKEINKRDIQTRHWEPIKENKGAIPMGQIPDVKELIDAGFYLLQSRSVTGQIIYVDGGQHILGNGV